MKSKKITGGSIKKRLLKKDNKDDMKKELKKYKEMYDICIN